MSDSDQREENGDEPPSGVYELKSTNTPQKRRRLFQRKSDNIVIGINLATILSILYASHTYITSMEKRVTTTEILLTHVQTHLTEILDKVETHVEKDTIPCP